jgi:RHS repeat-associated protein
VTDENDTVVQTLDYYPYGATRISTNTGGTDSARKYVNRFADQSNLDYLNARYYDPARGQFITEDPIFWSSKQNLANPQSLNSYSYANDNPVSGKDPDGLSAQTALQGPLSRLQAVLVSLLTLISQPSFVTYTQATQAGFANASHPIQSAQSFASGVYSYGASTGSALKTIGRSDSGDYLLGQRAVDVAALVALRGVPLGAAADSDAVLLAERAKEVTGVLDPIAASMRTTAVLRTNAGDIVAGGGKDLTKAQIASLKPGESPATPMPGSHAEVTAITSAINSGSTPQVIGVSRAICPQCQAFIESTGGNLKDSFTATW